MQKGTHARADATTRSACSPVGVFNIVRKEDNGVGSLFDRSWVPLLGQMLAKRKHLPREENYT